LGESRPGFWEAACKDDERLRGCILDISVYLYGKGRFREKDGQIVTKRTARRLGCNRMLWLLSAGVICFVVPIAVGQENAAFLSQAGQAPTAHMQTAPQWQIAAGGKKEFDVASVRQDKSNDKAQSNVPLTAGRTYVPSGGVFSATNQSLFTYILFAYKVRLNEAWDQWKQLPQWARTDSFDIQAKTEDHNPTKDQVRLMMQSLLEDRFKLVVHWETREVPIFGLILAKPGRTGPQLKPHPADSSCSTEPAAKSLDLSAAETLLGVWPNECGTGNDMWATHPVRMRAGARDVSMEDVAGWLSAEGDTDLPIEDRTGLSGNFDLIFEFAPEHGPSTNVDSSVATFRDALKDQLGLKLVKQKASARFFVIDHVERPSEN
jgi:uncharacterized protein (TIGR03435 family)